MLTEKHIDWYMQDILRAYKEASDKVVKAERLAFRLSCRGCSYCRTISRHKNVLESTLADLLIIVASLKASEKPSLSFTKKMYPDTSLYRGFITDTGEYVDMFNTEHETYRKKYADEHGKDRAYRMITVSAWGIKTHVQFFDRKYAPTQAQYATLRELMIEAEGSLCFHFVYDTNHPS